MTNPARHNLPSVPVAASNSAQAGGVSRPATNPSLVTHATISGMCCGRALYFGQRETMVCLSSGGTQSAAGRSSMPTVTCGIMWLESPDVYIERRSLGGRGRVGNPATVGSEFPRTSRNGVRSAVTVAPRAACCAAHPRNLDSHSAPPSPLASTLTFSGCVDKGAAAYPGSGRIVLPLCCTTGAMWRPQAHNAWRPVAKNPVGRYSLKGKRSDCRPVGEIIATPSGWRMVG